MPLFFIYMPFSSFFFIGWLQFHRQAEVITDTDGTSYLSLTREDGQPFQQKNETNC